MKYAEDTGEPYQQIEAEMAGSTKKTYTFMLFEDEASSAQTTTGQEETATVSLIKEDVTAQYKGEFSGLTKAYCIYHLTKLP